MSHTEEQPTTNEATQPRGPGNWLTRHMPEKVRQGWVYIAIGTMAVAGAAGSTIGATEFGLTPFSHPNNGGTEAGATYTSITAAPDARGNDHPSIYMPQAPSYEGGWNPINRPDQNQDAPKRIDMQPGEDTKS